MVAFDNFLQPQIGHMGVNLGGGDVGMTEQQLQHAQIGTVVEHMGGKGVAQAVRRQPFDADRLGCVGASYGGYSVFYLAGVHQKRFKAFIAHAGIFNLEMQYMTTEEMWFANWDMGGAPWDKENKVAQRTFANSPHHLVANWDTPILVIHGERDYRILAGQGMAAFNAAKLRGIPAELLIYPDENHWILRPQNALLWQRTFFAWLDKYLK